MSDPLLKNSFTILSYLSCGLLIVCSISKDFAFCLGDVWVVWWVGWSVLCRQLQNRSQAWRVPFLVMKMMTTRRWGSGVSQFYGQHINSIFVIYFNLFHFWKFPNYSIYTGYSKIIFKIQNLASSFKICGAILCVGEVWSIFQICTMTIRFFFTKVYGANWQQTFLTAIFVSRKQETGIHMTEWKFYNTCRLFFWPAYTLQHFRKFCFLFGWCVGCWVVGMKCVM